MSDTMHASDEPGTFESALERLQESVSRLEASDLTLEEAFKQWEAGCKSYVKCRSFLESAKSRIETLEKGFADEEPLFNPMDQEAGEEDKFLADE